MDAKKKIEEMLQKRRNGDPTVAQAGPLPAVRNETPPPTAPQVNSAVDDSLHSSALDRISAMLKQRQSSTRALNTNSAVPSPAPTVQTPALNEQSVIMPATMPAMATTTERRHLCRVCLGAFTLQAGIFVCSNCQRRYIKQPGTDQFFDLLELPYGYCDCCELRTPLLKAPEQFFPKCSITRETYVPSAGRMLRLNKLPFGLCRCCPTPQILTATDDQQIRCPTSGNQYQRNHDGSVVPKPVEQPLPVTDEIDAALNDGNAAFYYGGFIGEQIDRGRRRRRR